MRPGAPPGAGRVAELSGGVGLETDPAGWTGLDPRGMPVAGVLATVTVAVLGATAVVAVAVRAPELAGPVALWTLAVALAVVGLAVATSYARWRCSRYRITADRVELRTGVVVRRARSLAIGRVRTVDVTAGPVLRAFGLVTLRVGTGQQRGRGEATLRLRPVERMEADRLRTLLLDRMRSAGGPPAGPADGRIAELDPRWLRYGVLTAATPLFGIAVLTVVLALVDRPLGGLLRTVPPAVRVVLVVVGILLAGTVLAFLVYAETWSGFRLDREPGSTLRVRRGVLTTRSISLEERRLTGVELVEPLGVRLAGAARVDAVATGLLVGSGAESTEHRTLLPTAPRRLAERVAAVILGESRSPTAAALRPHPPAARRRRLRRAALVVAPPVVALVVAGVTTGAGWPVVAAAVLLAVGAPVGAAIAIDTYRGLGHALVGGYLVVRAGSLRRTTVALHLDGVIGWTVRQTVLQRRTGLVTLGATTAAGRGAFHAHDVDGREALRLAAEATPSLLVPFLASGCAAGDHPRVAVPGRQQDEPGAEERRHAGEAVEGEQVEQHQLADGRRHQDRPRHP
ncbi:PH domain-containing protein [Pseudonocardia yuanmonensis]|uniref:PH domain-containing protein n=1 Tax=Pseudonocardia yuanmonensis TaxID=1095914 RepID=UPI0031ECA868